MDNNEIDEMLIEMGNDIALQNKNGGRNCGEWVFSDGSIFTPASKKKNMTKNEKTFQSRKGKLKGDKQ